MSENAIIREIRELRARVEQMWKNEIGGTPVGVVFFSIEGVLLVEANPLRLYNTSGANRTISKIFLSVGTAPTGASILVDVHKDGTTIFTNQTHRPAIAAGDFTGYTVDIDVSAWADNSYLEVFVDQVGSGISGSDLVIHIKYT